MFSAPDFRSQKKIWCELVQPNFIPAALKTRIFFCDIFVFYRRSPQSLSCYSIDSGGIEHRVNAVEIRARKIMQKKCINIFRWNIRALLTVKSRIAVKHVILCKRADWPHGPSIYPWHQITVNVRTRKEIPLRHHDGGQRTFVLKRRD